MQGAVIRSAREKAGLTQMELAIKTDIPQGHISKLERDKLNMKRVRVVTLDRLCKALKITPNDLLGYAHNDA